MLAGRLEVKLHPSVTVNKPLPQGLLFPTCEIGAVNPPTCLSACCAIRVCLKTSGTQALSQPTGGVPWGAILGHLLCAPLTVSSNSQSVILLPGRPVLSSGHISLGCHNRCVRNAAPHLPSKLPVFLTLAIASLQLGHQPFTPPHSPVIKPGSVLLPYILSSGCRSCHALTTPVQATSVFHLDYRRYLLTLSASGFAPPPPRPCNQIILK